MSDPRISKLPQWAQNEISRLSSNYEATRAELQAAFGEEKTLVEVEPYKWDENKRRMYLPDRVTVRFKVENGFIDVNIRDGRLDVSTSFGSLCLFPRASNVASVSVAPLR